MAKITKTNANKYSLLLKSGPIDGAVGSNTASIELFAGGGKIDLFVSANPSTAGATTFDITGIYGQYNGNAISSLLTKGSTSPLTVSVNNYIDVNSPLSSFLPVGVNSSYENLSAIGFSTTEGTNYYLYNIDIFFDADPITGEPIDIDIQANLEVLPKNGPSYSYWYDNYRTITNIQSIVTPYFQGTPLADTITGTFEAEWILGGAGNDVINGADGNDAIDGGLGNDAMTGGLGDDTYYVDAAKDKVTEKSNQGIDTVFSSISHTLGSNVENLTLYGTSGLSATGNAVANVVIGSSGNDTINGALGNDTLTGGVGNDTFVFNTALNATTNVDTITDFTSGDKIALGKSIFKAFAKDKTVATEKLVYGDKAIDSNDFLIYDQVTGKLYYDADGTGKGLAVQIALIGTDTHAALTAADFNII